MSDDDIENCIYGLKNNDDSIDGFYLDETNRVIHFMQFKAVKSYRTKLRALKKESVDYFINIPQRLENNKYIDTHKNERVREIAEEFLIKKNKYKYSIEMHFFHLGYNPNPKIMESYSNLKYYDIEKIKDEYLEYKSKLDRTELVSIEVKLQHGNIQEKIGSHRTFISLITGNELVKLRETYKFKLFDKNLRFSLGGKNKINKDIIKTAKDYKGNFFLL